MPTRYLVLDEAKVAAPAAPAASAPAATAPAVPASSVSALAASTTAPAAAAKATLSGFVGVTAMGVYPPYCVVEMVCGDEGEPEVWMPAQVLQILHAKGKVRSLLVLLSMEYFGVEMGSCVCVCILGEGC